MVPAEHGGLWLPHGGPRVGARGKWSGWRGDPIPFRSDPHVALWVVCKDDLSGRTFVLYVGEDVTLPPRPPASYLPSDVLLIRLKYLPYTQVGNAQQADRFTIRDQATIHQAVGVINSLTDVLSPGVIGCSWDGTTTRAWIQFVRRKGHVVKVRMVPGCYFLVVDHTRAVVATGGKVWNTIEQVVTECRNVQC